MMRPRAQECLGPKKLQEAGKTLPESHQGAGPCRHLDCELLAPRIMKGRSPCCQPPACGSWLQQVQEGRTGTPG